MRTPVKMPSLGADADEARVVAWLKNVGDHVVEGEIIAEIETDKATVELESPASGTLIEILVPADADVGPASRDASRSAQWPRTSAASSSALPARQRSAGVGRHMLAGRRWSRVGRRCGGHRGRIG